MGTAAKTYVFRLGDVFGRVKAYDKEGAFISARLMGYKGSKKDIRLFN